jgi:integrase
VRQGFFERDEYEAVRAHLPRHLHAVVDFMYLTGWRSRSEVLPLTWPQIDFAAGTVRLEPRTTKNRKGRTFVMTAALRACLEGARERVRAIEREQGRIIPHVFTHDDGRPIKCFRKSFETACRRAGVPGRIPHDFRRTAVRNLERAGVPRSVAMAMTGHKTEAVYRRYDIVSERDLYDAAARIDRLADGQKVLGHKLGHNRAGEGLPLKGAAV